MPRSILLTALTALLAGCSTPPPTGPAMPDFDQQAAATNCLAQFDKNQDGSVSKEEAQPTPALTSAFGHFDRDGNGLISAEELNNRFKFYMDSGLALFGWSCEVRMNGAPLSGATVTLTPETFLGPAVQPATGVTDNLGVAFPVIDDKDLKGARFGLYRVQISKNDASGREAIPASFNEQSNLGLELATDNRAAETRRIIDVTAR